MRRESRLGGYTEAAPTTRTVDSPKSTQGRRQDGYVAPDAADRADAAVLAAAYQRGYRLAVPCLDCRRMLTAPKSLATHRGPTCRRRAAEKEPG